MVLLRVEGDPAGSVPGTHLAERFVDDMDGQLREIGIGDIIVGKHIGRMMSMLGGRLGAYRAGLAEGDLAPALVRNLYRGTAPAPAALAHTRDRLTALRVPLDALAPHHLPGGQVPCSLNFSDPPHSKRTATPPPHPKNSGKGTR